MMRTRFCLVLLLLLGSTATAFAELREVRVAPPQPSSCDPVAITALGVLPDACYEIVSATIQGPGQVCAGVPCAKQFFVNITVRQPNPAATCLAVNVPYNRTFRVGTLPPGDYVIGARERVIPYYSPDSTDSIVSETHASLAFTVRADSTCAGPGCYSVSFRGPDPRRLGCDEIAPPGGTACIPLTLSNSVNVGGLQTTAALNRWDGGPTAPFLHMVSVEAVRRASGFQVSWSNTGQILLYSTSGAVIPPGDGPVLRVCYAVAPGTPPDRYLVTDAETIVADPSGTALRPCPTPAFFAPGVICVVTPGCDVNGDGISDVLDIIRLVRCALASSNDACPDSVASRADCNGDGTIDIRDVICCVRKIVAMDRPPAPVLPSPVGTPQGTSIAFQGPVSWTSPTTAVATVRVNAAEGWGGVQFSVDRGGTPFRIEGMKLENAAASPGVMLESAVDASGVAHAMLFGTGLNAPSAGVFDITVTLDRTGSGSMQNLLRLVELRAGNTVGAAATVWSPAPVLAVESPTVAAPVLIGARPNPFATGTDISFVLPADARAVLSIYDVSGRLIRRLVEEPRSAGANRVHWDGTDARGRAARSGVYFAKLTVGSVNRTERIMLLR